MKNIRDMYAISQVFIDKLVATAGVFSIYFIELSLLFLAINFCVTLLQQRFQTLLQKMLKNNIFGYIKAILLGALTPFLFLLDNPIVLWLITSKDSIKHCLCVFIDFATFESCDFRNDCICFWGRIGKSLWFIYYLICLFYRFVSCKNPHSSFIERKHQIFI